MSEDELTEDEALLLTLLASGEASVEELAATLEALSKRPENN